MHLRRSAPAALLSLLLLSAACGEPSGPGIIDPRVCQQTYEFGNTGCVDVEGIVTDTTGRPLGGAYVGVRNPVDPTRIVVFSAGYEMTDLSGRYHLRIMRMAGDPPVAGPDTISVWIRGAVPPPSIPGNGGVASVDSVAVRLQLSPVDSTAVVVTAPTLRIPPFRPATSR